MPGGPHLNAGLAESVIVRRFAGPPEPPLFEPEGTGNGERCRPQGCCHNGPGLVHPAVPPVDPGHEDSGGTQASAGAGVTIMLVVSLCDGQRALAIRFWLLHGHALDDLPNREVLRIPGHEARCLPPDRRRQVDGVGSAESV